MTEARTKNDLKKNDAGIEKGQRMDRWRAAVLESRAIRHPPSAGEQRNAHDDSQENLRQAGVRDRHSIMQIEKHRQSAQDGLSKHCPKSSNTEPPHPSAPLRTPEPDGQNQGEKQDRAGNLAV